MMFHVEHREHYIQILSMHTVPLLHTDQIKELYAIDLLMIIQSCQRSTWNISNQPKERCLFLSMKKANCST